MKVIMIGAAWVYNLREFVEFGPKRGTIYYNWYFVLLSSCIDLKINIKFELGWNLY